MTRLNVGNIRHPDGTADNISLDSSGRLLVGTSTARNNVELYNTNRTPTLQVETSTASSDNGIALVNNNGSGWEPFLTLGTSGGSSVGSNTLVGSGTAVGSIAFSGNDGDQFVELARITGFVDGTPGADDMPGRLSFLTTADGASSPTEAMRIDSSQNLRFNSGYGSVATAYGVRAWIHFDGNAATIGNGDGRGNVSSVTDNGTGDYTLNFSNNMPDQHYAVCGSCSGDTPTDPHLYTGHIGVVHNGFATGSCRIVVTRNQSGAEADIAWNSDQVMVAIVR